MFHVYYSEKAESTHPIFFCQIKKGNTKQIVKATHAFTDQSIKEEYLSLQLDYLGEFICYVNILEWATASGEKLPIPAKVDKKPHQVNQWAPEEEVEEEDDDNYE
jgi:hypothetical protein